MKSYVCHYVSIEQNKETPQEQIWRKRLPGETASEPLGEQPVAIPARFMEMGH